MGRTPSRGDADAAPQSHGVRRRGWFGLAFRHRRNHVVVCGLGPVGTVVVREWARAGESIVAIAAEPTAAEAEACEAAGAELLVGAPRDPALLDEADVAAAGVLVAACADEATNVEVVLAADRLCAGARRHGSDPLLAVAQVLDPALTVALEEKLAHGGARDHLKFHPLSVYGNVARLLLARHPPDAAVDLAAGRTPHLVILGLGPLGEGVLLHAIQACAGVSATNPRITVFDRDAVRRGEELRRRCPQLERVCRLAFVDVETQPPADDAWDALPADEPATGIYLCLDDDDNLRAAHTLRTWVERRHLCDPVIHVGLSSAGSLPRLDAPEAGRVVAFGDLAEACSRDLIVGSDLDGLAKITHAFYLEGLTSRGVESAGYPAGKPWPLLPETYRRASRRQADHIDAKLRAIGCRAVPAEGAAPFFFSDEEAEALAWMEHVRWLAERAVDGWRHGAVRDDALRHHDLMVDYDQLDDETQERDRLAVRSIPALLERAGRAIARDLVVGVLGTHDLRRDGRERWSGLLAQEIGSIAKRFPGRRLVAATALSDPAGQTAAAIIVERPQGGLVVPLLMPVEQLIGQSEDGHALRVLLERAERCFAAPCPTLAEEPPARGRPLGPRGEAWLEAFLAEGSDVLIVVGPRGAADPRPMPQGRRSALVPPISMDRVRVETDPVSGTASWNFGS